MLLLLQKSSGVGVFGRVLILTNSYLQFKILDKR